MTSAIGCTEAVRRLWDLLDDELGAADRQVLDEHLSWCLRCCGELAFARELRAMLREKATTELPDDVQARLEGFIDRLGDPGVEVPRP